MIYTVLFTLVLILFDLASKYIATLFLQPLGSVPLIPGLIGLEYVLNDGAAFSLFAGNRIFLIGFTGIALLALSAYLFLKKPKDKLEYHAMMLVLAGGIGNLIGRIADGYVVDFFNFEFMHFAVFNLADCFVCIGLGLYLLAVILQEFAAKKKSVAENAAPESVATLIQQSDSEPIINQPNEKTNDE